MHNMEAAMAAALLCRMHEDRKELEASLCEGRGSFVRLLLSLAAVALIGLTMQAAGRWAAPPDASTARAAIEKAD